MTKPVRKRPEGFHTVNPYLTVKDAARVLDFLVKAFGAEEVGERFKDADGRIMHAAVRIGDSMVEIGEAPETPMPANLHMYVDDVDGTYQRALAADGGSLREPTTTFYGERSAGVKDPGGNGWWLACHVEDVSPEEMKRRAEAHANNDCAA